MYEIHSPYQGVCICIPLAASHLIGKGEVGFCRQSCSLWRRRIIALTVSSPSLQHFQPVGSCYLHKTTVHSISNLTSGFILPFALFQFPVASGMLQGKGKLSSLRVVAFPIFFFSFYISFRNGASEQKRKHFRKAAAETACLFSHTVALKKKTRQEANLHIETFQLLLLGLRRACRAPEGEELRFKLSL